MVNPATTCKICLDPDTALIEEFGREAEAGTYSWREAERRLAARGTPFTRRSLVTHMQKHVAAAEEKLVDDEFDRQIEMAVEDLFRAMRHAPAEVKPMYLAAIRNARGLKDTKPSQQHLIMALKSIQEMTGMKQEQRMMLVFAEAMFKEVAAKKAPVLDVVEVPALGPAAFATTVGEED